MTAFEARTVEHPYGPDQTVHVAGSGPPCIWLHGIGGLDPDGPFLQGLAERFTVYAPLAPGFNDVAELRDIPEISDLAVYYDDLATALGLDRFFLAGHSFGAMLAGELAALSPSRVERLLMVAPPGLWDDERPLVDLFAVPLVDLEPFLYGDPSKAPTADFKDIEAYVRYQQAMTTVAKYLWPIPERGIARRAHRIGMPTLLVFGAEDRWITPDWAGDWTALLPSARAEILPGIGHLSPIEGPEQLLGAIDEFLGAAALS